MPYKLRKAPKRDLYWVVGEDGKKHSKEPLPRARAEAQMRALYSAMRKEGGAEPDEDMDLEAPTELPRSAPAPPRRQKKVATKLDLIDKLMTRLVGIEDVKESVALARNIRKEINLYKASHPTDMFIHSRLPALERMMERKGLKGRGKLRGGMERTNARSRSSTIDPDEPPLNRRTATGEYQLRRTDVEPFKSSITGALMRTPAGYADSPISDAFFEGTLLDKVLPPPPKRKEKEVYPKNASVVQKSIIDTRNANNEYTFNKLMNAYNSKHGLSGSGLTGGVQQPNETLNAYVARLINWRNFVIQMGGLAAWQGTHLEEELKQALRLLANYHPSKMGGYSGGMDLIEDEDEGQAEAREMEVLARLLYLDWEDMYGKYWDFQNGLTDAEWDDWVATQEQTHEDIPDEILDLALDMWEDADVDTEDEVEGGRISDIFRPSRVLNEIVNPQSNLRRRLTDVSKGVRKGLPPSARSTLEQYGDELIQSMMLRRDPVQQAINKAFDLLTLGQWSKAKSAENYDNLFHLGLVVTLQSGKSILIEKNEVINIGNPKPLQSNSETLPLPPLPTPTSLNEFIMNGVKTKGDSFYTYDPFSNNCQDFIAVLLQSNNSYTPEAVQFVKQPVESLVSQLPSWTQPLARGITDLGAIANVALEGAGHATFTSQLNKAGMTPSVYLKIAQKKAKKAGYGNAAKLLGFATDGVHKLAIPNEDGKLIPFGRVGYGDFIIWSHLEKVKKTPHGSAEQKRMNYRLRAEKIRGDWQKNPFSPNNLAIRILW